MIGHIVFEVAMCAVIAVTLGIGWRSGYRRGRDDMRDGVNRWHSTRDRR